MLWISIFEMIFKYIYISTNKQYETLIGIHRIKESIFEEWKW